MARKRIERNIAYDDARKKYFVTLQYGFDEKGKQVKKYKTCDTKTEARKILREHENKRDRGACVLPAKTTVAEWMRYWLEQVVRPYRAPTTYYGYAQIIKNHIIPCLGSIPLQKLTPNKIQSYYAYLNREKKLSLNTIRKHHDLMQTAFALAVKQDVLLQNPISKVEPPQVTLTERSFYTPEDLAALLSSVKGTRLELTVYLAAFLGLRREEICGLTWDCIDFTNKVVSIKQARTTAGNKIVEKETKTLSSNRRAHIPDPLLTSLTNAYDQQQRNRDILGIEYHPGNYVVCWEDGRPYRPNYLSELFSKFIKDNSLPPLTLHGLRHTFATLANHSGATIYDISKALGHSNISTTAKIYTHLLKQTHQETIDGVANLVDSLMDSDTEGKDK